jgi:protein-S-isoprenylcysteine O-methyltransferase Ste14
VVTSSPENGYGEALLPDYFVFILRFLLFAAAHSLFAANRVKGVTGRLRHGEPRGYRLTYNLLSITLFGWVMAAYSASPVLYFAPGVWSLVMYLAQLVCGVILVDCVRRTGTGDFLGIRQLRRGPDVPHQLVTGGYYAIVRHPLYLFSIAFLLLNPVMTAQWLLLTVLSTPYFVIGALIEERRLLEEFGDQYRQYRQRVPFIIPHWGSAQTRAGRPIIR